MRPTRGVARLTSSAVASVGSFAAWPRPSKRHSQAGFLDGDAGSSKSVMPGGQYRNQSDNQEDSKPGWAEANEVRRHTN
jgi:hypothetical protein